LIDSRHGIKDVDREVMKMMDEAAVSYQAVLTKCDKIGAGELAKRQEATAKELAAHVAAHPVLLSTSARDGGGIPELRAALAALAAPRDF
jgi:GTP-binding protein